MTVALQSRIRKKARNVANTFNALQIPVFTTRAIVRPMPSASVPTIHPKFPTLLVSVPMDSWEMVTPVNQKMPNHNQKSCLTE